MEIKSLTIFEYYWITELAIHACHAEEHFWLISSKTLAQMLKINSEDPILFQDKIHRVVIGLTIFLKSPYTIKLQWYFKRLILAWCSLLANNSNIIDVGIFNWPFIASQTCVKIILYLWIYSIQVQEW